ncbi:CLUMA_CG008360, isoform A [Clunio marinus]|uniref:CLUMA_CG008360, isoform A n=1 Tax=Clunio marinus TaxID=568069 RepID=A0A1J1I5J7_9DIPT|nr:CLUMA_CG008360, isoform A [Clunio marinus]
MKQKDRKGKKREDSVTHETIRRKLQSPGMIIYFDKKVQRRKKIPNMIEFKLIRFKGMISKLEYRSDS